MSKTIFLAALICTLAVAASAQVTTQGFVVEDEVQAAGGVFDDTAFEPGVIAVDLRGADPVILFVEDNTVTGAFNTYLMSYPDTANDNTDPVTLEISGQLEADNGDVQTALATTGNIYFRQGGGCIDGADVFLFCSDKGTSTAEFVGDTDPDVLVRADIDANTVAIVSQDDGAVSSAVIGTNVFVELDQTAGAAQDAIGIIARTAVNGNYTVQVTEAALETAIGATPGNGVDIRGIAATPGGTLLVLIVGDLGAEPARVLEISDPAGAPSIATKVSDTLLNGTTLGAILAAGIDVTASGQIVVHSADSVDDVKTSEGYLHISSDGATVRTVIPWTAILAGTDLGTGASGIRNFDTDDVVAYDDGDDLVIVAETQDNEEFIALVRLLLPVAEWDLY